MMNDVVTYIWDGTYEGKAMTILERRNGVSKHIWLGYFDGGNIIKLYPSRPWGTSMWDGRQRKPMTLSVFEIKRGY